VQKFPHYEIIPNYFTGSELRVGASKLYISAVAPKNFLHFAKIVEKPQEQHLIMELFKVS